MWKRVGLPVMILSLCACAQPPRVKDVPVEPVASAAATGDIVGTTEPFASENVYFVLTDRFVNGDTSNDQRDQGGRYHTFDRPTPGAAPDKTDNIGYLGGDFRGLLENADYIKEMGFTAVWLTPIVDNPDEAFTGGSDARWDTTMSDRGKTGYHGYWGVNFYKLDEHLPSAGLGFAELTSGLRAKGLKTVLDVVANHGSPSFTMPVDQPKYGELYDREGRLIADHQNLPPEQLQPDTNPLHRMFRAEKDLVQLSNLDDRRPEVMDYLVGAYTQWLDQGADALRLDTIGHMPHAFWAEFARRIRAHRPGIFLFGERFAFGPEKIAEHTQVENGGLSVLDFPLKAAMGKVFENPDSDFAEIEPALFLRNGPYRNVYDLTTFYDNHDMARLKASDEGFINANNLLFTVRGIPVLYYGSEMGFMRGTPEHQGNRNYFGIEGIAAARQSIIREKLMRIAKVRRDTPALQRGVQINIEFAGNRAAFYRILQHQGTEQIALVLLNKGNAPETFSIDALAQPGRWKSAIDGRERVIDGPVQLRVGPHDVEVLVHNGPVTASDLLAALQ